MKPSKRTLRPAPDKKGDGDKIGGTESEKPAQEIDGDEGGGGAYGRPEEQGDDDQLS